MTRANPDNATTPTTLRRFLRWLLVLAGALAVPILPLLVLGLSFEHQIEQRLSLTMTAINRFWLIVGLLSSDLFLPVPSSAVSTYGGGRLGFWPALLASWLGMTIGGYVGYACGRWIGEPLARRLVGPDDRRALRRFMDRQGALAIFITRPLPILAEAALLLTGLGRLALWQFSASLITANLGVSAVYAAFGSLFRSSGALPAAIIVSAVIPLLITLLVRRSLRRSASTQRDGRGEPPA